MENTSKRTTTGSIPILALLALIGIAGLLLHLYIDRIGFFSSTPTVSNGTYLYPQKQSLSPISLIDHHAANFTLGNSEGYWNLWFFGYTHCPDICPLTLVTLNAAVEELKADLNDTSIQIIFVSVDPKRDTPARLKEYTNAFGTHVVGVTGDDTALAPLKKRMGILSAIHESEKDKENYLVDHSSSVFLTAPDNIIAAHFGYPQETEALSKDIRSIIKNTTL